MDFTYSDDQVALRDGVAAALSRHYDHMAVRRSDGADSGWDVLRDLGVLALPFPVARGGLGGGTVDLVAVAEVLGEHLMIAPYLASSILAGSLLVSAERRPRVDAIVERLAAGDATAALACGPAGAWDRTAPLSCHADADRGGVILSGECRLVLGGGAADVLLIAAQAKSDDRIVLAMVPPDRVDRRRYRLIDGRDAADLRLDKVAVAAEDVLFADAASHLERSLSQTLLVTCAESVGAMAALLHTTSAYATQRTQFGVPIRTFQAIAHRLADMKLDYTMARATLLHTTAEVEAEIALPVALSMLKLQVGRLGRRIGESAIQIHGGMGMTDEVVVGHLHKRLLTNDLLFGGADHYLHRLAERRNSR